MSISDAGSAARRCGEIADDGAQCWRAEHPTDPDAHDFTPPSSESVDGGRKWSDWIQMVHEVQALLTVHVVEENETLRQSHIRDWQLNYCRAKLAQIARVVGLDEVADDYEPIRQVLGE